MRQDDDVPPPPLKKMPVFAPKGVPEREPPWRVPKSKTVGDADDWWTAGGQVADDPTLVDSWKPSGSSGSQGPAPPQPATPPTQYPPDPTPEYEGLDFENMSREDVIKHWEMASDTQRSAEYHALTRRGKGAWKKFRNITTHNETTAGGKRRAAGGTNRAFYDNKDAGCLSTKEVSDFHRAKRDHDWWGRQVDKDWDEL
jgi:hypothetical protein